MWLKWTDGRQGSGYRKMLLMMSKLFRFDVYLIHFPPNSYIHWHVDPVTEGFEHHRLNIVLKKSKNGGQFKTQNNKLIFNWKSRIIKFRPDVVSHAVSPVTTSRWVLSIGWLRRKDGV